MYIIHYTLHFTCMYVYIHTCNVYDMHMYTYICIMYMYVYKYIKLFYFTEKRYNIKGIFYLLILLILLLYFLSLSALSGLLLF